MAARPLVNRRVWLAAGASMAVAFAAVALRTGAGTRPPSAAQFSADLMASGYAGTLSWAFNDPSFPFDAASTKSFADQGGCQVSY